MCKKIVLVGGGTGGHAVPLVNLAQYIRKVQSTKYKVQNNGSNAPLSRGDKGGFHARRNQDEKLTTSFLWLGENHSIEQTLAKKNNIEFHPIICGKLRRYFSVKTILLPFQILIGTLQAFKILFIQSPKAIISKGGYVSIPVAIAGWILRIPLYLHESDSIAGLANRIVGRFATGIFCSFAEAKKSFPEKKILGVGPILPLDIIEAIKNDGDGFLPPQEGRTQVLVSCGSQGSTSIFEALVEALTINHKLSTINFFVILGTQNTTFKKKFNKFPNITTYDFFYDQKDYFKLVQQCDLVITRSGSSVFEFDVLGLQMIMIPHPFTGNNHQYWNAKAFEKKGHILLEQKELSKLGEILLKYVNFHKNPTKKMVNSEMYDTITKILLS